MVESCGPKLVKFCGIVCKLKASSQLLGGRKHGAEQIKGPWKHQRKQIKDAEGNSIQHTPSKRDYVCGCLKRGAAQRLYSEDEIKPDLIAPSTASSAQI